jgi:NAD(P)-dependent dehydrogenase (short-subunit alcohol dehydrogenase family)
VTAAGQIDVVIQNAGSGICGAIEDVPLDNARAVWRILVEAPLRVLQLAAAHLRPRRAGLIVGVSSLAAELPISFGAHYSAGKAALSSLLAGLAMELKPFGVRVIDLRPGDLRTSFNDALRPVRPEGSPYVPWVDAAWKRSCQLIDTAPPADLAARAILRLLDQKNPPPVVRCGSFFQAVIGPLGPRLLPQAWLLDSIRSYFHLGPVDERERER